MTGYQVYQGNQVEGAGPLGLVLLTYEALYKSLGRSRLAIQAGDMMAEAEHTNRANEALIELATNLNVEAGGQLAKSLASLYIYMMNRLADGLCSRSTENVDEVMKLAQELRAGWIALQAQQRKKEHSHLSAVLGGV